MHKLLVGVATIATLGAATLTDSAHAAPRQIVVVVADGLNPQTMQFGSDFVKAAAGEEGAVSALAMLKATGTSMAAGGVSFDSMKGLLKVAAANGYKTGIVATDDVTRDAATLYDLPVQGADAARSLVNDVPFGFIAGGGRSEFADDVRGQLTKAGGTGLYDAASVEALDQEIKGKTLVLQRDADLSYALDQEPADETGLGELVTLAMQTLGANDSPYMLIVHDTLLNKASVARDTPALAEQLRTLDGVVEGLSTEHDGNANFGAALLAAGGTAVPHFTSTTAADQANGLFILSQLPMSYGKAGTSLKGADADALTTFGTDQYKGWKLSPENRAAILAGTMTPEAAIRASYEPAVGLTYDAVDAQPMAYTIGLDAAAGLPQTLAALAATKPAPATVVTAQ